MKSSGPIRANSTIEAAIGPREGGPVVSRRWVMGALASLLPAAGVLAGILRARGAKATATRGAGDEFTWPDQAARDEEFMRNVRDARLSFERLRTRVQVYGVSRGERA